MGTNKKTTITVQGAAITVVSQREEDFISIGATLLHSLGCSVIRSLAAARTEVIA